MPIGTVPLDRGTADDDVIIPWEVEEEEDASDTDIVVGRYNGKGTAGVVALVENVLELVATTTTGAAGTVTLLIVEYDGNDDGYRDL